MIYPHRHIPYERVLASGRKLGCADFENGQGDWSEAEVMQELAAAKVSNAMLLH